MTRNERQPPAEPPVEEDGPVEAKKERVLHTRIPAVLERDLKRLAQQLRVPVSNVVRTILEDTLVAADRAGNLVQNELTNAARVVSHKRETIQKRLRDLDAKDDVIGFQPMVLAQPAACARCGAELLRGAQGFLGMRARPGPTIVVCAECVPRAGESG